MAKRFAGFTPQQQYKILSKAGYTGPADPQAMNKFLGENQGAQQLMTKYARTAEEKIKMADGGYVQPSIWDAIDQAKSGSTTSGTTTTTATGSTTQSTATTNPYASTDPVGYVTTPISSPYNHEQHKGVGSTPEETFQGDLRDWMVNTRQRLTDLQEQLAQDPSNSALQRAVSQLQAQYQNAYTSYQANTVPGYAQSIGEAYTGVPVNQAQVGSVQTNPNQLIASGTGTYGAISPAGTTTAQTAFATRPGQIGTSTYQASMATPGTQQALSGMQGAQGTVTSPMQAAEMSPEDLAQLGLSPAQIDQYQKVMLAKRELQRGELVGASPVDMAEVTAQTQFEAAQADPSKQATVKGQLETLMAEFEGGETPAWAAGAMRAAMGTLQARGLGASSIAGQAVIQAAMESALPIAMQDAQTFASFEAQNLSNRQQAAMFGAQQRAQFLGMKFDQEFQRRVINAAKISDIANMNFTAEQQVALENARLAQTVDLANLSNRQAKIMADAAAMTQLDLTNLSNNQQAAVQNAQAFLQMDMANLSNKQQMAMFKAQAMTNALLSDQAATNAAKQFNAASENQTKQFMADLAANISKFNADQQNAVSMFNAGEANAVEKFNAELEAARQQFNASNRLVVAQANAQWRQQVSMTEFQAQHDANMEYASTLNAFTATALDEIWQRERDIMSFAWQSAENAAERATNLLLGDKNLKGIKMQLDAEEDAAMGGLVYNVLFGSGGGGGGGLLGGLF